MDNMVLGFFVTLVILIITHAVVSRRKTNSTKVSWPYIISLIISFLLLLIYITTLTFLFIEDTVWPHSGSLSIVFFMLMCPGILFHLFFLVSSLTKRKLPEKRILARIVT
ncbi:MAG: hypothetical protein KAR01_12570, partial [Desulfocapsa sp.]|nr:hypothetical protein [Desulfocapsa sp.]